MAQFQRLREGRDGENTWRPSRSKNMWCVRWFSVNLSLTACAEAGVMPGRLQTPPVAAVRRTSSAVAAMLRSAEYLLVKLRAFVALMNALVAGLCIACIINPVLQLAGGCQP
jgi:hypothetical protein